MGGGLDCDVMGFCEIVAERENAGTVRPGRSRGSDGVPGLGGTRALGSAPGAAHATRVCALR